MARKRSLLFWLAWLLLGAIVILIAAVAWIAAANIGIDTSWQPQFD